MLIESPDELRKWLTSHLEPLCDADPNALAKYVLALIRKDKSIEDLKSSMISQMDVFLQSETQNFVDMLFKIVDTKEYIQQPNNTGIPATKTEPDVDAEKDKSSEETASANNGEKIEADSTTPVREHDKFPDPRPSYDDREDNKKRSRPSPPHERRGPGHYRGGHRERDYQQRRFRSRSRSRSLSPRHDRFRSTRRRSRSPPDMRRRSPDRHPPRRGRSLDRGDRDAGTPTRDETGYTPTQRPRCRDYDEKGFCLRGDMCKFDHGNDAVVLEDGRGYNPGQPGYGGEPYVPGIPTSAAGISYPPPIMSVPPPGYAPLGVKRGYDGGPGFEPPTKRFDYGRGGPRGRGRGGHRGRGQGRGGFGGVNHSSSMLAVRNIPVEMNSILHLNGHFSKFGTLVNVQIQFEGDPSSALITFAGTSEAAAAFNSTEAIMNNRFIKVFWHIEKQPIKERLGNPANNNPNNVVLGDKGEDNESEEVEKVKEEKEKAIQAIQKDQEMLQKKHEEMKKVEEQRKEALAKQENLLKSKHDLLDGLIEQQKMLISKLEKGKGTMKAEEKTKIMRLLKELTNSIDRTRQDIKTSLAVQGSKSKADIQKELLDAEMELFSKQQDEEDTTEIMKRVEALRKEASKMGISPRGARGGGRGGFRGRGAARGSFFSSPRGGLVRGRGRGRGFTLSPGSNKLDRRPTSLLVSGYELEEKEEIVKHFTKFGEIADMAEDEVTPSIIMKFKTRLVAESAMNLGKVFGDRNLQLSWYTQLLPGKEEEEAVSEAQELEQEEPEDDGYTPPQEDYLPPGLQEHEDSLSREGLGLNVSGEAASESADAEINEDLLDEDEDEEDEERSWKRRNNGEE